MVRLDEDLAQLVPGKNLHRLTVRVSAAQQVSQVEVRGWDTSTKKALVATTDLRGAIGFSSFCVLTYYAIANIAADNHEEGRKAPITRRADPASARPIEPVPQYRSHTDVAASLAVLPSCATGGAAAPGADRLRTSAGPRRPRPVAAPHCRAP